MLLPTTIKFLKELKKNNNKAWFEEHRPDFEAARDDFEAFISTILQEQTKSDSDLLGLKAKDCTFRINRDVRFSKDKSPYKPHMGAYLNKGGKKSAFGGYYFHCEPGQSFTGGGIWMPMPADVKKIRQEIDYCFPEFKKIVQSKKFISVFGGMDRSKEYSLVKIPKGYDHDNPAAEYLKFKSWVGTRPLSDEDLISKELRKKIIESFHTLQPMLKFLNRAMGE